MENRKNIYKNLPDSPGIYIMRDSKGGVLYVGKAASLKKRVSSYFLKAHESRIEKLVSQIDKIEVRQTDTVLEALLLEAKLIKELEPPYNIREKDGKSFLAIEITKDEFPRVVLARSKDLAKGERFGPFVSPTHAREALKIIRRIFPFNTHEAKTIGKFSRPCFDAQVGLCPKTCTGEISKPEYAKTIRQIKLFFAGKKEKILTSLARDMEEAAKKMDYEKAAEIRRKIFALQHIQDTAIIGKEEYADNLRSKSREPRIEGYDISNTSGTAAVGSMVVFIGDTPSKHLYRKFKIKMTRTTSEGGDDIGMLKEVLTRRLAHREWPLPDLILIDGGAGQINAIKRILLEFRLRIPIIGMVKGPDRKRADIIGLLPKWAKREILVQIRDEAHRFAISFHRQLRGREFLEK